MSRASADPTTRRLLLGLMVLTGLAMVAKAVSLSAPPPTIEAPRALSLPGYRVSALPSSPPRRGRELSHGTLRRFRLVPLSGAPEIALTLLPVRSRTATALSGETLGGKGLSMERVGAEVPDLALRDPRVAELAAAAGATPVRDQLLLGRGPADPAGRTTRLQTCLTTTGIAAVKAATLSGQSEAPRGSGEPSALTGRVLRLAGLAQTRHECLAVQLALEGKAGTPSALETAWSAVRKALTTR